MKRSQESDRHGPYTVAELRALPTLASTQTDDLKVDSGDERVWLSRMTVADGEMFAICHERLLDGRWTVVSEYAPPVEEESR